MWCRSRKPSTPRATRASRASTPRSTSSINRRASGSKKRSPTPTRAPISKPRSTSVEGAVAGSALRGGGRGTHVPRVDEFPDLRVDVVPARHVAQVGAPGDAHAAVPPREIVGLQQRKARGGGRGRLRHVQQDVLTGGGITHA